MDMGFKPPNDGLTGNVNQVCLSPWVLVGFFVGAVGFCYAFCLLIGWLVGWFGGFFAFAFGLLEFWFVFGCFFFFFSFLLSVNKSSARNSLGWNGLKVPSTLTRPHAGGSSCNKVMPQVTHFPQLGLARKGSMPFQSNTFIWRHSYQAISQWGTCHIQTIAPLMVPDFQKLEKWLNASH